MESSGWSIVSTTILNLMRAAPYTFLHSQAIANEVVCIVFFNFVDNTDLVLTAGLYMTGEDDIDAEMQDVLDTWEGGLKATGGALVPTQSYWYLIYLKCRPNIKWAYYGKVNDFPGNLTLPVPNSQERVTLTRLEVTKARKVLGLK
jgi:hypothetical protein